MGRTNVLITGAAGFLGSRITVELAKTYAVTALDVREPDADLFPAVKKLLNKSARPLHVPKALAKTFVAMQCALGRVTGRMPFERPWMLDYIDRPLVCDPSYTFKTLDWKPTPGLSLLEKLPDLVERVRDRRKEWDARNAARNARQYAYG